MAEAMETDMLVAEGTRLVIKEMVLENFKSYAGKQKVGPFHKVPTIPDVCQPLSQRTLSVQFDDPYSRILTLYPPPSPPTAEFFVGGGTQRQW